MPTQLAGGGVRHIPQRDMGPRWSIGAWPLSHRAQKRQMVPRQRPELPDAQN